MADQHLAQDQLVDLALGDVAAQEPLLRHLSACPRCRGEYDEISSAVDHTLTAAPRIEPTPGFDRTVLEAMGMSDGVSGGRAAGSTWHRPWVLVAAAAVVGVLAGIGATVAVTQPGDDQPGDADQPTMLADGNALVTADGERVGSVARSFADGQPVIVVGVTDGPVGVHYECRLQFADGRERTVGDWVLESKQGATWIVPAPLSGVEAVELVTDSGTVWSSARI